MNSEPASTATRVEPIVACDDSAFQYLFFNRGVTIAEVRRLNCDTLLPWPIGLLMGISDCGIDHEKRAMASVRAVVVETDAAIVARIQIVDGSQLIGELVETDDGDFLVAKRLRVSDFD